MNNENTLNIYYTQDGELKTYHRSYTSYTSAIFTLNALYCSNEITNILLKNPFTGIIEFFVEKGKFIFLNKEIKKYHSNYWYSDIKEKNGFDIEETFSHPDTEIKQLYMTKTHFIVQFSEASLFYILAIFNFKGEMEEVSCFTTKSEIDTAKNMLLLVCGEKERFI
mgnify:CR=1 FL=1